MKFRFSVSDLLVATCAVVVPLPFSFWIGIPSTICLALMAFALSFGFGTVALLAMLTSLLLFDDHNPSSRSVGWFEAVFIIKFVLAVLIIGMLCCIPASSKHRTRS